MKVLPQTVMGWVVESLEERSPACPKECVEFQKSSNFSQLDQCEGFKAPAKEVKARQKREIKLC